MSDTDGMSAADSVGADEAGNPVVEGANESVTETGDNDQQGISEGHPAWKEVLDVLPSSLHPIVTPALQKWDSGVQERFQQVQSKYSPYDSLIENGVDPSAIEQSLAISRMIDQDPKAFYARLGEWLGQGQNNQQQANNDQGQAEDDDIYDIGDGTNEREKQQWQELERKQELLAQGLTAIMQKEQEEQAAAKLDADLKALKEKHGDFDEDFVLNYAIANGNNLEAGVKKYIEVVTRAKGQATEAPKIPTPLSPGGATPSSAVDPATLSSQDTKSLVVNLLQQMQQQSSS